jgi:hypothetical protein
MFSCGKTRAEWDYSQGNRETQGKIAKKAEKMQIFRGRVEITAKTAAPRLGAPHSNGFRMRMSGRAATIRRICENPPFRTGYSLRDTRQNEAGRDALRPCSLLAETVRNYSVAKSA